MAISERFCCRECGTAVALESSLGNELYYTCQNRHCQKCVSVDCPEALAILPVFQSAPEPQAPRSHVERKAAYHLGRGLEIVRTASGWLVPSGTRAGVIHQVGNNGECSCEAGSKGKPCWHKAAMQQLGQLEAA